MLGEDLLRDAPRTQNIPKEQLLVTVDNEVLLLLEDELAAMDRSLADCDLPTPDRAMRIQVIPQVIKDELFDCELQKEISKIKSCSLNVHQQATFATGMQAVYDESYTQRLFFLNAPDSYGKTFLIEVLLATVRSIGKIGLAVASSGIAAELLEG